MKRASLLLLLIGCAHVPATEDPSLPEASFLVGSWTRIEGDERQEERWLAAYAGRMFGRASVEKDGKQVFFEELKIERRDDTLFYLASPNGRTPAIEFRLVEAKTNRLVFENPAHDDPQRIVYELAADGMLHARVELIDGSKTRTWVFKRSGI